MSAQITMTRLIALAVASTLSGCIWISEDDLAWKSAECQQGLPTCAASNFAPGNGDTGDTDFPAAYQIEIGLQYIYDAESSCTISAELPQYTDYYYVEDLDCDGLYVALEVRLDDNDLDIVESYLYLWDDFWQIETFVSLYGTVGPNVIDIETGVSPSTHEMRVTAGKISGTAR